MDKSTLKRGTEGEEHRGGGLGERAIHGQVTKATRPNTSEGVFISAETGQTGSMDRSDRLVRPVPWTGQTGWLDRSDRCQGPVKPVGLQIPPVHDLI